MEKIKKFNPLNVSSKFAICGLPVRVDTYKTCQFGCIYCFANNRKICEFDKTLQIGDMDSVRRRLNRIFHKGTVTSFLDTLISQRITWHCGGMSDPFQPCESEYHCTRDLVDISNEYDLSILFSTKSANLYHCNIRPDLHSFQLSVSNIENRRDIEPNIPDIEERLSLFRELKTGRFRVGIRIQPFIPGVTTLDIVKAFAGADQFTLEGIKLVPQNAEHKSRVLNTLHLDKDDFKQMGLLNLKPEIREKLYGPFISYFEEHHIPYSIADNDMHHIGTNNCCCGDRLVARATTFNNTYLTHHYGAHYTKENLDSAIADSGVGGCKCAGLFTSNRQEGLPQFKTFTISVSFAIQVHLVHSFYITGLNQNRRFQMISCEIYGVPWYLMSQAEVNAITYQVPHFELVEPTYAKFPEIRRVIFHNPATIVFWSDGTKTVVKCQPGDTFSKETGLMAAMLKRFMGNDNTYNKALSKWVHDTK